MKKKKKIERLRANLNFLTSVAIYIYVYQGWIDRAWRVQPDYLGPEEW